MRVSKQYYICAAFDTETTNYGVGKDTHAFTILYIFNDLRFVDLKNYKIDVDDNVKFYREENEAIEYIENLIEFGLKANCIPIICAYNLMFDMQTLIYNLNMKYDMSANAQSSTNVYTLDLKINDETVLRFWDCFHLEMRGLSAMGDTCGIEKAKGDWDYSLIRTKETPLTEEELFYAKRDVQVLPAYFKYLLNANEWMEQSDLGSKVITKTSLVRQMAQREIGKIKITKRNKKEISLLWAFEKTCKQQLPKTYQQYALRKSSFRGGLTFTAGVAANRVLENVASLDVTSMHHAFINGRMIPIDFDIMPKRTLELGANSVISKPLEYVLEDYEMPFTCAFHTCFTFTNIRLKEGTCFDKWQIAIIPKGKFKRTIREIEFDDDERNIAAENYMRANGYFDSAENPTFAFGKLYSADSCTMFLSELELWCITQVYQWDEMIVNDGELTVKFKIPPDYVTLQSNNLFEMKNDAKVINKNYKEGEPYDLDIPSTIPPGIAASLRSGELSASFFDSYYTSTVKGMFNGIYGTMAQDVFKPSFTVEDGNLYVDSNTKTTSDNFEEKTPKRCKVLYTYGLRIVGGSRMHLVIAMILLYEKLGDKITITGGDTDSLKIRCDEDVTNEMLLDALKPLHIAIRNAIDITMQRVRKLYPNLASNLNGIGEFECEKCTDCDRWKYHLEAWNKARISINNNGKVHITCAGLSRPPGAYTIEDFTEDLLKEGYSPFELLPVILGYNVFVTHELSFALEHKRPYCNDVFEGMVTDYLGNEYEVCQTEAIALYDCGRCLGDSLKQSNAENIQYLRNVQHMDIDDSEKWLQLKDEKPEIIIGGKVKYHVS